MLGTQARAGQGGHGAGLSQLLSGPNLLWSLGASLVASILDGGERQKASDQARAAADQTTSAYRQTVITALQEVEGNLAALAGSAPSCDCSRRRCKPRNAICRSSLRNRQLAAANLLLKNIGGS